MRRLLLVAVAAAALLAACGSPAVHHHVHLRAVPLPPATAGNTRFVDFVSCVSVDCGPDGVQLQWSTIPFAGTTGYITYACQGTSCTLVQVGTPASSPYSFFGMDCGKTYTLGVAATNGVTNSQIYTTPFTTGSCGGPPANTVLPSITGTVQEGQTLTANNGTWTNTPTGFTYQWLECASGNACTNITSNATSGTYVVQAADVGSKISVAVTATNASGTSSASSAQSSSATAESLTSSLLATIPATCSKYAAPASSNGSDANSGTFALPYLTLGKLVGNLAAGQTGCLRQGSYGSTSSDTVISNPQGSSGSPITLRSYPGEVATINGGFQLQSADYWTAAFLSIDSNAPGGNGTTYSTGSGPFSDDTTCQNGFTPASGNGGIASKPAPFANGVIIKGDHGIFAFNNVTAADAAGIAMPALLVGGGSNSHDGQPQGSNSTVEFNRIHDVSGCKEYVQGLYIHNGTGQNISYNWLWNIPSGYGIQEFTNPSGTLNGNVIDTAADGFVVNAGTGVTNTTHNVFMNSRGSYFETLNQGVCGNLDAAGGGSTFANNDCWNNGGGNAPSGTPSPSNTSNLNPNFVNAAAHNYAPSGTTPATILAYGLWDGN